MNCFKKSKAKNTFPYLRLAKWFITLNKNSHHVISIKSSEGFDFKDSRVSMYSYKEENIPRKENPRNRPRFPPIALTKPEKSINLSSVRVVTSDEM